MSCKYDPTPQVHNYKLEDLVQLVTARVPLSTIVDKDINTVAREIVEAEDLYYGSEISTEDFIANVKKALLMEFPSILTVDYLVTLHQTACTGIDDNAGKLRQGIGMTSSRVFPSPSNMIILLDKLVDEYNNMEDTKNKFVASMFVMKFLGIHPFSYGNGITARVLFSKISGTLASLSGDYNEYVEPLIVQDPITFCRYCLGYRKPPKEEPMRYLVRDLDWANDWDKYKLVKNSIKCLKCNEIIERNYNSFLRCPCGSVAVDGGLYYLRRLFEKEYGYEELSEAILE